MHRPLAIFFYFFIYQVIPIASIAQSQYIKDKSQKIENTNEIKNLDYSLNELTIKLLSDSILRDQVYPVEYSFDLIPNLISQGNIELAAWHLVHLYKIDQKKTLQLIKVLVKYFPHENLITNSYRVYAYADPHLLNYIDGRPLLLNPKKFEDITHRTNGLNTIFNFYVEKISNNKIQKEP